MSATLANIIMDAGFYMNDSQFSAAQGSANLRIVNTAYQDFAGLRKWRELEYYDNSTISIVAGTGVYSWPTAVVWKEEPTVSLIVTNQQNYPYRIWPTNSADEWDAIRRTGQSRPFRYRRYFLAGVEKIEFRPTPVITGDFIEIFGQKEITEFVGDGSSADTTPWTNKQTDRALSMWIAMFFKMQRGDAQGAQTLRAAALNILPAIQYTPGENENTMTPDGVTIYVSQRGMF